MSMADRSRMDAFEERLAALEVINFKDRIDQLEIGISAIREAGHYGAETTHGKAGVRMENEISLLRARIKKIEETI